jgi:hypothetical protein
MSTEYESSVKVITELIAKSSRRAEPKNLLQSAVAKYEATQPGLPFSLQYERRTEYDKSTS